MTIDGDGVQDPDAGADSSVQFRYGVVLVLMVAVVVFVIAAPSADWSRAVALGIGGTALVFAVATGRDRKAVRYREALVVGVAMAALILGVATGVLSDGAAALANVIVTAAIPVTIVRGTVRMLSDRGVTLHAVAGAVAIYLTVGLMFASMIGFLARLDPAPYFAQGTDGTESDRVYFSFTVLTTTGFGDFSAATPAGRALAVIEMLTGQLYLVTVIGLLIGNFAGTRRSA